MLPLHISIKNLFAEKQKENAKNKKLSINYINHILIIISCLNVSKQTNQIYLLISIHLMNRNCPKFTYRSIPAHDVIHAYYFNCCCFFPADTMSFADTRK